VPLYRPSELSAFLASIGALPKRTLSQNFLIDGNIVSKIVSEVPEGSPVLEIGPGPGVLTEALLDAGHNVVAVETDRAFAQALQRLDPTRKRLTTIEADILDCSWTDLVPKGAALVSNLPYHITTPIIERLVAEHHHFSSAVLMVQTEVARRLMDAPSSMVGVLLGCCYEVRYGFFVSRTCFWPKPKADSAVLCLHERCTPLVRLEHEKKVGTLVRTAFTHRRKTLFHSLNALFPKKTVSAAFQAVGLPVTVRPDDVSLCQWEKIAASLPEFETGNHRFGLLDLCQEPINDPENGF
jgi:16S rRNA (adenine1518-N6/adenine1519-N6)-dimethyltransferase